MKVCQWDLFSVLLLFIQPEEKGYLGKYPLHPVAIIASQVRPLESKEDVPSQGAYV